MLSVAVPTTRSVGVDLTPCSFAHLANKLEEFVGIDSVVVFVLVRPPPLIVLPAIDIAKVERRPALSIVD
jgi:hypothetical protein